MSETNEKLKRVPNQEPTPFIDAGVKSKRDFLRKCAGILENPRVQAWYNEHLLGQGQINTIDSLQSGLLNGTISIIEALGIAFIVGFQWNIDFEKSREVSK